MYFKVSKLEHENAFKVLSKVKKLEASGKKIINLCIGQPDFNPSKNIIKSAINALETNNHGYSETKGLIELRNCISEQYLKNFKTKINPNNILITPGAKPILFFVISILSKKSGEILIPNPGFPIYKSIVKYSGSKAIYYSLKEDNNFDIRADDIIEKVNEKTKLIIINSPSNPTGSIIRIKEIVKLFKFLRKYPDIYVLSDEIYSKIIFNKINYVSLVKYNNLFKNLIIMDGLSKSYAMTGWRLGWGIFPDEIIEKAEKFCVNTFSCVNNFTQYAAIEALSGSQINISKMTKSFYKRSKIITKGLNEIHGFSCKPPSGAFYCYPNIKKTGYNADFIEKLLLNELGIAVLSGNNFGENNENYIRISYASKEQNLKIALKKMKSFFNK